jgi:RNA recognition motif-containing protein
VTALDLEFVFQQCGKLVSAEIAYDADDRVCFYFILFLFIYFYFFIFYFLLFYFILFCFIIFCFVLFLFYFILLYFILYYIILSLLQSRGFGFIEVENEGIASTLLEFMQGADVDKRAIRLERVGKDAKPYRQKPISICCKQLQMCLVVLFVFGIAFGKFS